MKNFFFLVVTYYAAIAQALHCYKCGHLAVNGVPLKTSNRHIMSQYPSFDESCKTRLPNIHFLSFCDQPIGNYQGAVNVVLKFIPNNVWCTKGFIKGFMERVPEEVDTIIRDCVKFPPGWSKGCSTWTRTDLLNSRIIPVDFKKLASYFTANTTMQICTCKENGCDIIPSLVKSSQRFESIWRKLGDAGHYHLFRPYTYSKHFAEFALN